MYRGIYSPFIFYTNQVKMENTEEKAVNVLLNEGIDITIKKRSLLRFLGKKERAFKITPSYLGTVYAISKIAIEMNFEETLIQKDPFFESKVLAEKHVKALSLVIAIAILNSKWKIWMFKKLLSIYLLWRLTPSELSKLVIYVSELNNYADFMNSIRSVRGWRITQPKSELSPEDNGG